MRTRAELAGLVEGLRGPLREFVRETRVRIAVLVNGSGQVLAQHGFTRSVQVNDVASLAAASHSAARALGELTRSGRWTHLYNQGSRQQLFLAPFETPAEELILVAIFDGDSSLGLVRLFCDRLSGAVARLPELQVATPFEDAEAFERDLEAGVESVFDSEPPEDG